MKGASGHDDIAAPNELQRLSDELIEARSNFDKRKTAKKESKVHAADLKESAASFVQDAGLRMLGLASNAKLPAQHSQLAGDDQGKDQEVSSRHPLPEVGGKIEAREKPRRGNVKKWKTKNRSKNRF